MHETRTYFINVFNLLESYIHNMFYDQYFIVNLGGVTFCCLQTRYPLRRVGISLIS